MIDPGAASHQRLVELAEKIEMIAFLRKSTDDVDAGRTETAIEALERSAEKHKLRPKGA